MAKKRHFPSPIARAKFFHRFYLSDNGFKSSAKRLAKTLKQGRKSKPKNCGPVKIYTSEEIAAYVANNENENA